MIAYYFIHPVKGDLRVMFKQKCIEDDIMHPIRIDGSSIGAREIYSSMIEIKPSDNPLYWYFDHPARFCLYDVKDLRYDIRQWIDNYSKDYFQMGIELEFFLGKSRPPRMDDVVMVDMPGNENYCNPIPKDVFGIFAKIMDNCPYIERIHSEVADRQYEVSIQKGSPLEVADRAAIVQLHINAYFEDAGYDLFWSPKPYINSNGNGRHIHLSSPTMDVFEIATNLIKHPDDLIKALTNDNHESRLRRKSGQEAPQDINIGFEDRGAAIRTMLDPGKRIEIRVGDNTIPIHRSILDLLRLIDRCYEGTLLNDIVG